MPVEVCGDPAALGTSWPPRAGVVAELVVLEGSEGLSTSATKGTITLGGKTLKGSLDGEWRAAGAAAGAAKTAVSRVSAGNEVCFDVQLAPYTASMLVLRRGGGCGGGGGH